ncbi:T9SS type A sorting domain-containing protein, partial [uncultured Wocania sp.]|uniref:T9SS type A sorting domain-containing protein n=1 Tax=uncultured Wocania sp. TaxID=2834404 RepID=UPI0030FA8A6C
MKKIALFITILCNYSLAQTYGSGAITFDADQDLPIAITATSLFDNGLHTYQINGYTNQPISFENWIIQGALSNEQISLKNRTLMPNPNGSFNLYVNSNEDLRILIFDINGRLLGRAKNISNNKGQHHYYHSMIHTSDGIYFIRVIEGQNFEHLKFVKKSGKNIDINQQLTSKGKSFKNLKTQKNTITNGLKNYQISWQDGYGIVGNSREIEIVEGNENNIFTGVYTLEKPYFNIKGKLLNAYDGTARLWKPYTTIGRTEVLNGNIQYNGLNVSYGENNSIVPFHGILHIEHGTYENIPIDINITSAYPGENILDLGNITVEPVNYGNSQETGDFAISIRLYKSSLNTSVPIANTTIKVTNTHFPDSTYLFNTADKTQAIFGDVYIPESNNPSIYEIRIKDNRIPESFKETVVYKNIYQDNEGEINGNKVIDLDLLPPPPDYQNITMVVRDFETLDLLSGATVDMYEKEVVKYTLANGYEYWGSNSLPNADDKIIESGISDSNGQVYFPNVSREKKGVYFKVSKDGFYKKVNFEYKLPDIESYEQTDTILNITALKHLVYEDSTPITADTLMVYNTYGGRANALGVNSEFVLGHMKIYIDPEYSNRDGVIEHLNEYAELLGVPNGFQVVDTPFPEKPPI